MSVHISTGRGDAHRRAIVGCEDTLSGSYRAAWWLSVGLSRGRGKARVASFEHSSS